MVRTTNHTVENNFTKGLVTYATALNFPENACTATQNCIFHPYGLVERRKGMNFESGGSRQTAITTQNVAVTSFLWKDVSGDGTLNFFVLQLGQTIFFWQVDETLTTISTGRQNFTINLSTYQTRSDINISQFDCQYAAGNGYLFIVNPYCVSLAVFFNAAGTGGNAGNAGGGSGGAAGGSSSVADGSFGVTPITIVVRDLDGVPESDVNVTARPPSADNRHLYNLLNQGWTLLGLGDGPGAVGPVGETVTVFQQQVGVYPSNADIWFKFKNSKGQFDPGGLAILTEPAPIALVYPGNTQAPRGHFILDAWGNATGSDARSVAFGSPLVIQSPTSNFKRPSTVAFFQSRVFYSGVQWTGYSQNIYFSRIITTVGAGVDEYTVSGFTYNQFGACFQQNDPSSETTFDLLSDDGGVIRIPEMGNVVKLFPLQNALLVFATNGIWVVSGSQGVGFTADSYTVNKLSSVRCISGTSFVDVLGYPYFWTHEGIYRVTVDTTANVSSGGLKVESLTDFTIKPGYFDGIPGLSKLHAIGTYDPIEFVVQWAYNSSSPVTEEGFNTFDSILNFNTLTGAFYVWTFDTSSPVHLRGLFTTVSTNSTVPSYRIKYLASAINSNNINEDFWFADQVDARYVDWFDFDSIGKDYTSIITTGFRVHGEADKRFQNTYVTLYLKNLLADASNPVQPGQVASTLLLNSIWDYALNSLTNKFSSTQRCRMVNNSYSIGIKKMKVRGSGHACQLNFTSESGLPMNIEGWAVGESINKAI